jgi:hypothetical protein
MKMDYCMFENTFHDLYACYQKLRETSLNELVSEMSTAELQAFYSLPALCTRFVEEHKKMVMVPNNIEQ